MLIFDTGMGLLYPDKADIVTNLSESCQVRKENRILFDFVMVSLINKTNQKRIQYGKENLLGEVKSRAAVAAPLAVRRGAQTHVVEMTNI